MTSIFRWIACFVIVAVLLVGPITGCGGKAEPQIEAEDVWARPSMAMPVMDEQQGSDMSQDKGTMQGKPDAGVPGEMDTNPATGATGAVFMRLVNRCEQADKLVSAETDVASTVELHKTTMTDGVMKMSPVQDIEIPAKGEVVLKPGDYHIMLLGLKQDLNVGDEINVKLNFEKSQPLALKVVVREM